MKSRILRPSESTSRSRRTATVTTSASVASRHSCINSNEAYLPVPTTSRPLSSCVPKTSGASRVESLPAAEADKSGVSETLILNLRPSWVWSIEISTGGLAATDEGNDFELIAFDECAVFVVASRDEFAVAFDGQVARFQAQLLDQASHRRPGLDLTRLLIDVDLHVAEECTGGFGASSRKWIVG